MSQQSCSSMLQSMGNTHTWMCGGALTVFMMGKFGLEKGPRQLFKWGFRLTSSCHKCRCLDASAAAKNCVCGEAVSRRGPVPGYLVLLDVVRAVLPANTPSLSRPLWQPHVGLRPWITAAGLCVWCRLSPVQRWLTPGTFGFFQLPLQEGASNRSPI